MRLLDPETVEWWLPAGYAACIAVVEVVRKVLGAQDSVSNKQLDDNDTAVVDSQDRSLRTPLLQASGEETSDLSVRPQYSVTSTGVLWATLTFSWGLCVYQGVRAVVEAVRNGTDTPVFLSSVVLCVAWAMASVLRSRDHWREASKPVKIDGDGSPTRRRMWWALWPFFNLSMITAITAEVNGAQGGTDRRSDFVDVVADDRLWNLAVLVLVLVLVSYSTLRGATVRPCTRKPNAEFTAGLISATLFSWFTPYVALGQTKQLGLDDLPIQIDDDLAGGVWEKLDAADPHSPIPSCSFGRGGKNNGKRADGNTNNRTGIRQVENGADTVAVEDDDAAEASVVQHALLWRMWRITKPMVVAQGLWQLVATLTEFVPSLAMQQIVDFVSNYDEKGGDVTGRITLFVVLLFVGPVLQGVADGRNFHLGRRIGCRVRGALVGSVFRKMLKMDTATTTYSSGQLTNLVSVDAQSVLEYSCYTHFIWATSLQVVVAVGLLFYVLGISAFGGVVFMVLSVPLGKWTTKKTQAFQKILMKRKDDRMSVVGETMQGIRIIKLFAWERDFRSKIDKARRSEMRSLRSYMVMMAGVIVQWNSVTTLVGLCTFLVHTRLLGRTLTASQGFTSLSLFSILRFPLLVLPDVVNFYLQALVSLKRIEEFLGRGDVEGQPMNMHSEQGGAQAPPGGLLVRDGTFAWPAARATLTEDGKTRGGEGGISVGDNEHEQEEEKDGEMTAALLPRGAGEREEGTIFALPQAPTLQDVSLEVKPGELVCIYGPTGCGKSSLLLSLLGEVRRLQGTVHVNGSVAYAAQRAWIQNATLRDNVLFGSPYDPERYQRVLSACALTSDLELLEAGDMTEIGEKGINLSGGQQQRVSLARAVYAQADVYLLDDVLSAVDAHVGQHIFDRCVRGMLRDKAIIMVTHQVPMTARYAHRVALMSADGRLVETGPPRQLMRDEGSRLFALINKVGGGERLKRQRSVDSESGSFRAEAAGSKAEADREKNELVKEEHRQRGAPGSSIYVAYNRAAGGILLFLVPYLACHVSFNGLQFGQNLLLSRWVDKLEADENDNSAMWAYIGISFGVIAAVFCRSIFQSLASLKASTTMHDAMAARVMSAPVGWFERTPLGRILNRFSSDIQEIDKDVMEAFSSTLVCTFSAISIVVVISYTVPYLIVALIPISFIAFLLGKRYLNVSRELKRLDSVSKSPIYAHFSESVNGVSTIRAFGAQERFVAESCRRVDACNRAHFYLWVSNRWFNVRIQLVGASVAVLAGAFVVWWGKDHIEATVAGLALLYALQFTDALKYLVRQHALLEMQMNSVRDNKEKVERILEYTKDVPQEAAAIVQGRRPDHSWPSEGGLTVENLTLQYPNTDAPVIRGMSFRVEPRTRVGIVGRTGAGKSSLTAALFRLVEPSAGSVVMIDGVDALSMGLEDLRSRLAIVPQDPILFRGTVRSNLDPFHEYNDTAMWDALRQAHMDSSIRSNGGLDAPVEENGGNLSVGERQLMCMARALLRQSAILVMDEATANVDPETDLLIQSTMREEFRNCTVLCIAHRLHTIIYYDRVMVLERGKLVEYASPLELLNDPNSLFYALCKKTGSLEELKATARAEQDAKLAGGSTDSG